MTQAIQVRVDKKLKKAADLIFEDLGIDTPTAIRLFLKKVVTSRSIPFALKSSRTENGFTEDFEQAIIAAESEDAIGPFKSANAAIAALHKKPE